MRPSSTPPCPPPPSALDRLPTAPPSQSPNSRQTTSHSILPLTWAPLGLDSRHCVIPATRARCAGGAVHGRVLLWCLQRPGGVARATHVCGGHAGATRTASQTHRGGGVGTSAALLRPPLSPRLRRASRARHDSTVSHPPPTRLSSLAATSTDRLSVSTLLPSCPRRCLSVRYLPSAACPSATFRCLCSCCRLRYCRCQRQQFHLLRWRPPSRFRPPACRRQRLRGWPPGPSTPAALPRRRSRRPLALAGHSSWRRQGGSPPPHRPLV